MCFQGSYGKCHKVANLEITKMFACKMMHRTLLADPDYQHHIENELSIHESLKHPNIVEFIEYFKHRGDLYIIMSLCENKSLRDYVKMRSHLTTDECRYFIWQILMGVCYMHDQGVIHRDLKLTNVLLDGDMRVKIGDFGLAIRANDARLEQNHICGTTNYLAPEIFDRKGFSFGSDIWAVGVIAYMLLFDVLPFIGEDSLDTRNRIKGVKYRFVRNIWNIFGIIKHFIGFAVHFSLPRGCDHDVEQFISSIFERDLRKRPNARECLNAYFLDKPSAPDSFPSAQSFVGQWKAPASCQSIKCKWIPFLNVPACTHDPYSFSIFSAMRNNNATISGQFVYPIIVSKAEYIPDFVSFISSSFKPSFQMLYNRFDAICRYNNVTFCLF